MSTGQIDLKDLRTGYNGETVLQLEELTINAGEFVSILGPSGCGKSTLLNTIAGFITPQSGVISIDGVDITNRPPHQRNLGVVFQNYALFPHLTVRENVDYGLKIRKLSKAQRARRIEDSLRLVGLSEYATRRPHQLSGGQQQRVALARSLAYEPAVLLLDEPLSNLDAKLRKQMQTELRQIQKSVGTTMVFVTHDQVEALTLSDRVVVFNKGTVEQVGTPQEVYNNPATEFVADFLGGGNILRTEVLSSTEVALGDKRLPVESTFPPGSQVLVVLRREQLTVAPVALEEATGFPTGTVVHRAFSGDAWHLQIDLDEDTRLEVELPVSVSRGFVPEEGSEVAVRWDPAALSVIPA